jgi:hypothetical protein
MGIPGFQKACERGLDSKYVLQINCYQVPSDVRSLYSHLLSNIIDVHIKSDSSILDSTILKRLEDRRLFIKIPNHDEEDIFHKLYVNNTGSKIDKF